MMSVIFLVRVAIKVEWEDEEVRYDEWPGGAINGIGMNKQREKSIEKFHAWGVTGIIRLERRRANIRRVVMPG